MTTHQFRFGVTTVVRGDAASWGEAARALEHQGYATMLVPDTTFSPSPFLALAAAAAATSTLRLGTWVLNAPLRTPAAVVREAATLQELSNGRLELGVGAGRPGGERDAESLGVEWGRPGQRVDRVAATIDAVLADLDPAPPIVLAGRGNRMLRLAARAAATLALPLPPTATVSDVAELATAARAAGPRLELALQIVAVGDDIPSWLRQQGLDRAGLHGAATALSGDPDRDADTLERLRADTGVSYLVVPQELALAVAPVVRMLAGR